MLYALELVHRAGYLYSDLKPDNIVIEPTKDRVKVHLIDFGFCSKYLIESHDDVNQKKFHHIAQNELDDF